MQSMTDFTPNYRPKQSHLSLGDGFFDPVNAPAFPKHRLIYRNQRWAQKLGLDGLSDEKWVEHFGKFTPLPDNFPQPVALRYHGHQFQSYNPELGDGRGFLFAQLESSEDGRLLDLATKGSGQTPYSRQGDGRLTLKGGVREVLATELLEALGVYTSKSFSLIETGEALQRGDEPSPTRSSVLVRLGHSHIRFGSFQRHAYLNELDKMEELLDHAIRHYMPEILSADPANTELKVKVPAFLKKVAENTGQVVGSWFAAGFVHVVLNTDNMNINGESFDYGPYRFLPTYEPGFTAAYFDQNGLYAFGRQPQACAWNLEMLGGAFTRILDDTELLSEALASYGPSFQRSFRDKTFQRLGLETSAMEADQAFMVTLFKFLHESQAEYDLFFFDWFCGGESEARAKKSPQSHLYENIGFEGLRTELLARQAIKPERLEHDYFKRERPCSLLYEEIEDLWRPIHEDDNWSMFESKLKAIRNFKEATGFSCDPI
jgi:serine/tyrosine/threonine adenylyltransferase